MRRGFVLPHPFINITHPGFVPLLVCWLCCWAGPQSINNNSRPKQSRWDSGRGQWPSTVDWLWWK